MINPSKYKRANLSFDTLKGMQSVRATFTLYDKNINGLKPTIEKGKGMGKFQ